MYRFSAIFHEFDERMLYLPRVGAFRRNGTAHNLRKYQVLVVVEVLSAPAAIRR